MGSSLFNIGGGRIVEKYIEIKLFGRNNVIYVNKEQITYFGKNTNVTGEKDYFVLMQNGKSIPVPKKEYEKLVNELYKDGNEVLDNGKD